MTVPEMLKNAIASSKIIASRKSASIGKISRLKNLWGAVAQLESFDRNTSFDVIGKIMKKKGRRKKEEGRRKKEEGTTKDEENIIFLEQV